MDKIKDFLHSIGFGKNEAEIYINLVGMGTSSVLDIAKKTKIHRSNIYDAIRVLLEEGMVYEINGPTKLFQARHPKSLVDYLSTKKAELEQIIKDFEMKISEKPKEKVAISKGIFAIREAVLNLIQEKKDIFAYGIPSDAHARVGPKINDFHKQRIKNKINMFHIYNSDAKERIKYLNSLNHTEARVLPGVKYDSFTTTFVCGDKVIMVFWEEEPMVLEIEDGNLAESYRQYFNIIWKKAKS